MKRTARMLAILKRAARMLAITVGLGCLGYFATVGIMSVLFAHRTDSFVPKESADAAAWVQAVGSVAAIAASYLLGMHQARSMHKSAHDLERKRQIRREEGAYRLQIRLLDTCEEAIKWMASAGDVHRFTSLWNEMFGPSLSAAIRVFDSIPLFDACPIEQINHAFAIRNLADEVSRQGGRACSPPPPALEQREFIAMQRRTRPFRGRLDSLRRTLTPPAP